MPRDTGRLPRGEKARLLGGPGSLTSYLSLLLDLLKRRRSPKSLSLQFAGDGLRVRLRFAKRTGDGSREGKAESTGYRCRGGGSRGDRAGDMEGLRGGGRRGSALRLGE